ncbi:MAG: ribonuclease D [Candidatus Velthaea sp.]|jgi:ribonuclease D
MTVSVVDNPSALTELLERVRAARRIGIDTEFHNERSYTAQLMVVQLAFDDGVAIVDPLALTDLRPLAEALATTEVVGHALSSDLRILAEDYTILPQSAFDTQVAAAFCGYGLTISLLDLVRELAGVTLRKSQTVSDWSARPLSVKQIDYLVDDVRYLFPLADRLEALLAERGRAAWAREEMRSLVDLRAYRPDARRLYLRVSGNGRMSRRELGILNELAALRDGLARERNIPLKFVMPDDVLAGLVSLRPRTIEDLGQLRRLDNGIKRHYGARIIEAVARGEAIPESELPQRAPRPLGAQREALVATMAVLMNAIAAENDLPTTLLLTRSALERIARETPVSAAEIDAVLNLTPWRRSLVVEPLWELLIGERVVRVEGYLSGNPRTTFVRKNEELVDD